MKSLDLSNLGLSVDNVLRNCPPSQLYEEAIRREPGDGDLQSRRFDRVLRKQNGAVSQ